MRPISLLSQPASASVASGATVAATSCRWSFFQAIDGEGQVHLLHLAEHARSAIKKDAAMIFSSMSWFSALLLRQVQPRRPRRCRVRAQISAMPPLALMSRNRRFRCRLFEAPLEFA
jgi:hypothetical protein